MSATEEFQMDSFCNKRMVGSNPVKARWLNGHGIVLIILKLLKVCIILYILIAKPSFLLR